MMNSQQREFCRLGWTVVLRLWKLDGHIRWLMERVQIGSGDLDGDDVDALYERYYRLHDALDALKRSRLWRSVDVDFDVEDDAAD